MSEQTTQILILLLSLVGALSLWLAEEQPPARDRK